MDRKQVLVLVALLALIAVGTYFRSYHLDYPSIGYHNWKESRYLTPARNFVREGFFAHGFFVPAYDLPKMSANPNGAHSDFFPFSSIAAALMMSLFGFELWAARLPVLIVSVALIPLVYLFMRRLAGRDDMALVSAALVAINPMMTFFSHNVDQMPFGIFFVVLSWIFFLRWNDHDKPVDALLSCALGAFAVAIKYTYAISLVPLLAIMPWPRLLDWKARWRSFAGCAVLLATAPLWWAYSSFIIAPENSGSVQGSGALGFRALFQDGMFQTLRAFFADNYTLVGLLFAGIGFCLFLLLRKNVPVLLRRFLYASAACTIAFFFIISDSLRGHSYHQYPIALFVLFLIAYLFTVVGQTIANVIRLPFVKPMAIALLFFLPVPIFSFAVQGLASHTLFFSSVEAANRQWDTQFFGLDIAGNYIKSHKKEGERVMHSTHQAYGVLWHGDIKGTRGLPPTVDLIKEAETELNANWLFIYNWDFGMFNDPNDMRWPYLTERYRVVQVAFIPNGDQPQFLYLLLRRNGTTDINTIGQLVQGKPVRTVQYELTRGPVSVNYVNIEP